MIEIQRHLGPAVRKAGDEFGTVREYPSGDSCPLELTECKARYYVASAAASIQNLDLVVPGLVTTEYQEDLRAPFVRRSLRSTASPTQYSVQPKLRPK